MACLTGPLNGAYVKQVPIGPQWLPQEAQGTLCSDRFEARQYSLQQADSQFSSISHLSTSFCLSV